MASLQRKLQFHDKDQQRISGQYSRSFATVRLHPAVVQQWKPETMMLSLGSISTDAQEKLYLMQLALSQGNWMDAQFYGYEIVVVVSKSLLLSFGRRISANTAIINLFEETFIVPGLLKVQNFHDLSLRNPLEATEEMTRKYAQEVEAFCRKVVGLYSLGVSASR